MAGGTRKWMWRQGLGAAAVAASVNTGIYLAGRAADIPFLVRFAPDGPSQEVSLGQVILSSVLPLAIGSALAVLFIRWGRGLTGPQVLGGLIAVLSAGAPLSAGTSTDTQLTLASMHFVAGLIFIFNLQRIKRAGYLDAPTVVAGSRSSREAA
jgi:hypothetical protein